MFGCRFLQNIFPAYYEDSDYWRRFTASKLKHTYYKRSKAWHSWHSHSQSSSRFLSKNTSSVAFKAIQKATRRFTIPYLSEKWGCFNQSHFALTNCTFATPWNGSELSSWEKPSGALQSEKVDFLLRETQKAP